MKARLIIKNFGPITDLDIEIKKYNILIGPQASGKSTIAKLLCVIHDYFKNFLVLELIKRTDPSLVNEPKEKDQLIFMKINLFKNQLSNFRISSYIQENSYLFFEDNIFSFELIDYEIIIKYNLNDIKDSILRSFYIPPERIALPMISESLFELTLEQSSLPKSFLSFGRDFTIARGHHDINKLLPVFNLSFEFRDGKNYIKEEDGKFLLLEESSSAIQSNVPLLLILQNINQIKDITLFVIEELELHSFPKLQKQLLYHVIEKTREQSLSNAYVVLPTHSPYILSAANNLLFANNVGNQNEKTRLETNKIINEASWIDRDDFAAYYIDNGTAKSIVNEQTGLIDENELDGISEDLGEEFDLLMDLYKPAHA